MIPQTGSVSSGFASLWLVAPPLGRLPRCYLEQGLENLQLIPLAAARGKRSYAHRIPKIIVKLLAFAGGDEAPHDVSSWGYCLSRMATLR